MNDAPFPSRLLREEAIEQIVWRLFLRPRPEGTLERGRGRHRALPGLLAENLKDFLVRCDLAVQAGQAFENVGRALAAARARPEQVTKITIFVVDYRDEHLPAIEEGRVALFGDHKPADTLVGVERLAHPGCLIEIEAIAVVDDP